MCRCVQLVSILCLHYSLTVLSAITKPKLVKPPPAKHGCNPKLHHMVPDSFAQWTEGSESNLWESSGLLEGDIMTYARNGVLNKTLHWPDSIVPFYIDEEDFSPQEIVVILKAIKEYDDRTCIKFRPYIKDDVNWVIIKGDESGCWSSVGMQTEGQVLNLHTPKCVQHGVIIHELLHAMGFYHQQSSSDRDNYVKINWENILDGHEHNFNKYNESYITSYGIKYDYGSIMHYSSKAFSKNGNLTIESLQPSTEIGQRKELSEKDILKLNKMYRKNCQQKEMESEEADDIVTEIIEYFLNSN